MLTFKYFAEIVQIGEESTDMGGNLIIFEPRKVKAQGLKKTAIVRETLYQKLHQYLLNEEIALLPLLKQLPSFPRKEAHMLYPGCGVDILFPLLYAEKLFPSLESLSITMVDRHNGIDTIKTVLDDLRVSFEHNVKHNGTLLEFYWQETRVSVRFIEGDIFALLHSLPSFDVYFERLFRIMKDGKQGYEEAVVKKLKDGGVLISDSGFENAALQKFSISQKLSSYGEMVVGVKS